MKSFEAIDEIIDIEKIGNLPIDAIVSEKLKSEELKQMLSEFTMTEEQQDEILDVKKSSDVPKSPKEIDSSTQHRKRASEIEFMDNLMLYSSLVKNLELVEKKVKKEAVKKSINRFTKLIGVLYKAVLDKIADDMQGEELEKEMLKKYEYILKTGIPIIMQHSILDSLGTPKLKKIIAEVIEEVDTDFEKFMLICLYSDLRLENYIGFMKQFLKNNKSKLIKETAMIKLLYYRLFYHHSENDINQLNNLIFDVTSDGTLNQQVQVKTRMITDLNKKAMIIQSKDEAI